MPFTPFHMGAAIAIKPLAQQRMSVIAFGLAQIAMDIEPALGMIRGSEVLHGPSHTLVGAVFIGLLVGLLTPRPVRWLVGRWNKEVSHHGLDWLKESTTQTPGAILSGAFFGTISHIFLDCFMHADIRPLSPFSDWNPLLGLVEHDHVYAGCAIAFVAGFFAWVAGKWIRHKQSIQGPR
jgi:membrane-bound metal-dependent hydrolase YbcI (DUF457 family)